MFEPGDVFGIGPLLRGDLLDLHQAEFSGLDASDWIKPAFAPDDGLDEQRIDAVTAGRRPDLGNEPVFPMFLAPQVERDDYDQEQAHQQYGPTPFHASLLIHRARHV